MKILFINQFFWPDSSATSQQLTDAADGIARLGNEVSVLCGDGGYAAAGSNTAPRVKVLRVKSLPFARGKVGRLLSYMTFYVGAVIRGIVTERHDVVVSLTTPPLICLLGTLLKVLRGSRHYVWEHDLYPDVALDLGYFKKGGIAEIIVGRLADMSRVHADGVIALGECMKERLTSRGIPGERIWIAQNWANSAAINPLKRPGDPNEVVVLYSGNLGLAHEIDTITGTLRALRADDRFRFLFVGSGGKRKDIAAYCMKHDIKSVEMRDYVTRDNLSSGLAAGDIGLVTQQNICCGSVVPSKVYGILAAGRPVLFVGPKAATPAQIIAQHDCGWQIDCGDVEGLTTLLQYLAAHREVIQRAGARARRALVEYYDLPQSVERLAAILGAGNDAVLDANGSLISEPSGVS